MRVIIFFLLGSLWVFSNASAKDIKDINIEVSGGVNLSGQYFSPGKPGPGILLLSMCDPSTDKSEWKNLAPKLQERGFHVLIFDYRGFGESEGQMPDMLNTMGNAMAYWRNNWMTDVQSAYNVLLTQKGVDANLIGIGGASCGVFMGLEFTLAHPNVKTFVALGGPVDEIQTKLLNKKKNLPILIISGDEGPALEWSDEIFSASEHLDTRLFKYKIVTHGTLIFKYEPLLQDQIVNWFSKYL